ncbi:hypothetical protein [Streptomyces sp. NPDC050988]|uniref:hypothetical protein n=1 Tax=Streptomyces sp. NPDC050988 TaxID=3365637 RepID=UPI0037B7BBDF
MAGEPVDVPAAHPVPLLGRGEDDVRTAVVRVVDAAESRIGEEYLGERVVCDASQQIVGAAARGA